MFFPSMSFAELLPLNKKKNVLPTTQKFLGTTPQKQLVQFHQNFREMINTMSS
jgi:hypothetical protein